MKKTKLKPQAIVETIFDISYLIFALAAGIMLISKGAGTATMLYGAMALILGFGDAFHLLPRVYSLCTDTMDKNMYILAFGKLFTSITMTVFYLLLYLFWQIYYGFTLQWSVTALVAFLATVRIILCLLPQNKWFSKQPSFRFAIYRNIPFALLGAVVAVLFAVPTAIGATDGFTMMPYAIVLSFAFYLVVVLGATKRPALGAFMLPKTCVYIWMICMGFSMLK